MIKCCILKNASQQVITPAEGERKCYMIVGRLILLILLFCHFASYLIANDNKFLNYEMDTTRFIKINYENFLSDTTNYEDTTVYCFLNNIYYVANYSGATPDIYMFNNDYIIYLYPSCFIESFEKIPLLLNTRKIEIVNVKSRNSIKITTHNEVKSLQNLICCNKCYRFKFKDFIYMSYNNKNPIINPHLFSDIMKLIHKQKVRKKFNKYFP